MKNLIHKNVEIDEILDILPIVEDETIVADSRKEARDRSDRDGRRGHGHDSWHPTDSIWPYRRAERICEAYKGKGFDEAFSHYCAQVPQYQQHIFVEYIDVAEEVKGSRNFNGWYLDEEGRICKRKRRFFYRRQPDAKPTFYSDDYKTERQHKVTGKKYPENSWNKPFTYNNYKERYPKARNYNEAYTMFENEYQYVMVEGWFKEFDSHKDREYLRLKAEQVKRRERAAKEEKKARQAVAYALTHDMRTAEQKRWDANQNLAKIQAKGFSTETSFRKDPEPNA